MIKKKIERKTKISERDRKREKKKERERKKNEKIRAREREIVLKNWIIKEREERKRDIEEESNSKR